jgi:pyruvate formate lyase activating enzyme
MEKQVTGRIYDIQGFSVQDGPGIRTTVFLKGCPLRCPWCHSPESQQFFPQLCWIAMRCPGMAKCGKCLRACARGAISPGIMAQHAVTHEELQLVKIDRSICNHCGDCAAVCYQKALYICGTDYNAEEIVTRVCRDIPFYENSGGGVTFSGGEPLCQPEFLQKVLETLKGRGVHTAVDTTGHVEWSVIESILPCTDLFLFDLKHMDSEQHRIATGVGNELILDNAKKIAEAGGKMQIRIPVIPQFNDSEENMRETGLFCESLGPAVTVSQLLPYHNLGVMKYQRIDDSRLALEAAPPSDEKIHFLKQLLEQMGLPVTVH